METPPRQYPDLCAASRPGHLLWTVMGSIPSGVAVLLIALLLRDSFTQYRTFSQPFNDPWEGVEYLGALRVYSGQCLYPDHAIQGPFYVYGPVPPLLYAMGLHLFGCAPATMLLCRFIFTVLTLAAIAGSAWVATRSRKVALFAVALFIAADAAGTLWLFSVRPDTIATMFLMWSVFLLLRLQQQRHTWIEPALAMLLAVAAALCKANYLLFLVPMAGFMVLRLPRRSLAGAFLPGVVLAGTLLVVFNTGDERYFEATATFARHPFSKLASVLQEIAAVCNKALLLPIMLTSIYAFQRGSVSMPPAGGIRENLTSQKALLLSLLAAGWIMGSIAVMKRGGSINSLFPATALLSLTAALGMHRNVRSDMARAFSIGLLVLFVHAGFSMRQVGWTTVESRELINLAEFVRQHPDVPVYAPSWEFAATVDGHNSFPSAELIVDRSWGGQPYPQAMLTAFEQRTFRYILTRQAYKSRYLPDLKQRIAPYYRKAAPSEVPELLKGWDMVFVPNLPE